uniref:Uncharacterized protein n=1 Tax=Oryza sativa subsp. japonica TaxID=39947 RepID=Q8H2R7_ORYSJ|nr:hypothetical protein [Oryza sativa Japonica Group]
MFASAVRTSPPFDCRENPPESHSPRAPVSSPPVRPSARRVVVAAFAFRSSHRVASEDSLPLLSSRFLRVRSHVAAPAVRRRLSAVAAASRAAGHRRLWPCLAAASPWLAGRP